jgi:hypothetical protein
MTQLKDKETDASDCDTACGQLCGGAWFFAMHSCEYSKVYGDRCTKLLRLENLQFIRDKKELPLKHPELHLADTISITFYFQKNDERDAVVTQHRTNDPKLCPVRLWAVIAKRILAYPGTDNKTSVNTYMHRGKLSEVSSKMMLNHVRVVVIHVGEDNLGFKASEMGTHSIRSGVAMAMYLANVPVFTIMLIGCWSSDSFLRYIRRQVQEFSSGIASRMITSSDFYTIPDFAHCDDPRVSGNFHNFAAPSNIGHDAQQLARLPRFSLHH